MIGASQAQYNHSTSVIDGIFYLVAYGFLLHGALERNKKSVLVSIICTGVVVAFGVLIGLIAVANIDVIASDLADVCKNRKSEMNKIRELTENDKTIVKLFSVSTSFILFQLSIQRKRCLLTVKMEVQVPMVET